MDAFWAGLAVGFGVLLLGRVQAGGAKSPGLPSIRSSVSDAGSGSSFSGPAPGVGNATSGCNCCGTNDPTVSVTVLGTPFAPAPVTVAPATPYQGESQWYAGQGQSGPGAATWGVN